MKVWVYNPPEPSHTWTVGVYFSRYPFKLATIGWDAFPVDFRLDGIAGLMGILASIFLLDSLAALVKPKCLQTGLPTSLYKKPSINNLDIQLWASYFAAYIIDLPCSPTPDSPMSSFQYENYTT